MSNFEQTADERIDELEAEVASLQAQIDRLMLEHCPGEMTQEQLDLWAASQKPA